jgi:hypothetical protein
MIDLHDAVLEELRLDYEHGTVLVRFRTAQGTVTLRADDVFMVRAPRRQPWGLGNSHRVNRVHGPGPIYSDSHAVQIEIQMQSGDTLEIEAGAIAAAPGES